MYSIWTVLPNLQSGSYAASIIAIAPLVMAGGCAALSSLRQALCYVVAAVAGLMTLDLSMLIFLLAAKNNSGGFGGFIAIVFVGLFGFAVGFAGGLTAAVLWLPKPMFVHVGEMTRVLLAAAIIVVSFTVIVLASNTDFFEGLAQAPSKTLMQFFRYLAQGFGGMLP